MSMHTMTSWQIQPFDIHSQGLGLRRSLDVEDQIALAVA
jgi:hypothetical protein